MSTPNSIYLAGPMNGLTWRQASEWRDRVEEVLVEDKYEADEETWVIYNPLNGEIEGCEDLDEIIGAPKSTDTQRRKLSHTATGITAKDEFYLRKSDWVLANFTGENRVSIGTCWELGFAWALGKQIISVIPPSGIHDHAFVRRRSHIFVPELEEALEYLSDL